MLVHNRCKLGKNIKNDPNGIGDPGTDIDDPDFGIWLDVHEHRSGANVILSGRTIRKPRTFYSFLLTS